MTQAARTIADRTTRTEPRAGNGWFSWAGPAALFLAVVLLYAPAARNGFIYDDSHLILEQPIPQSVGEVARVFAEPHYRNLPYYRPIARLTLAAQKALYGNQPGPYHLFNAALAAGVALAAYALLRRPALGLAQPGALLTAGLFAVLPVASSCVYAISGREALLVTGFALLALWAFIREGRAWYGLAMLMLAAALLCREQAVAIPVLFVLADVTNVSAESPGRRIDAWVRRYAPVALLIAAYFVVRRVVLDGRGGYELALSANPSGPLLSVVYALQATIAPHGDLVYEPPTAVWWSWGRVGAAVVVFVGLIALNSRRSSATAVSAMAGGGGAEARKHCSQSIGARRHSPGRDTRRDSQSGGGARVALFFVGWFLLSLLPTANLLKQETPYDERHVLLAAFGLAGLVGLALCRPWPTRAARTAAALITAASMLGAAGVSLHRAQFFRDDLAFYQQWLRTDPARPQTYVNLGQALASSGRIEEAIERFRQALERKSDLAEAHASLGGLLQTGGRLDEAVAHYQQALRSAPNLPEANNNLGSVLAARGQLEPAARLFRRALSVRPNFVDAHNNLGHVLQRMGQLDEAIEHCRLALRIQPDAAPIHFNLGTALRAAGRADEAAEQLRLAVKAQPDFADAHVALGDLLAAKGQSEEAIACYRRALDADPDSAAAHYSLGNALSHAGRVAEAAAELRRASQLAPQWVPPWNDLAWLLASQPGASAGDGEGTAARAAEAIQAGEQAAGLTERKDPAVLDTLAAAYAAAGQFDRAVSTAEEALALLGNQGPAALLDGIRKRLALYRESKPYREER